MSKLRHHWNIRMITMEWIFIKYMFIGIINVSVTTIQPYNHTFYLFGFYKFHSFIIILLLIHDCGIVIIIQSNKNDQSMYYEYVLLIITQKNNNNHDNL
jgi:hypothetical protein